MNYLTREDLLDLHGYALEHYGGRLGIASQDRLLTAVNAPRQAMFGAELYPDLASKTAVITFLLLKSRPFLGANEPTALLVMLRMLAINGAELHPDVDDSEIVALLRGVNLSKVDKTGLEGWLRERLVLKQSES